MRLTAIMACALTLTFAAAGCSKESAEKKGEGVEKKTDSSAQVDPAMTEDTTADTLWSKGFPIRNENNQFVTISTDFGDMTLELYRDVAPAHADSFVARSVEGFYDGLLFHRVINHFMIQGGDPNGNGTGNAGYFLNAEFSALPHQDGTLSMARGPSPNSASCQFFICLGRNRSTQSLDGQYTVFGQLIKGLDVLHAIGNTPVVPSPQGENSKPAEDIYIRKAFLSDSEGNPSK
ncbi:MAG: peptidylprolyl isomerase [bacterium]|nr:peptidylprolyl isomerase [bacterium]